MNLNRKFLLYGTLPLLLCILFAPLPVLSRTNETEILPPFIPQVDEKIDEIMIQNHIPSVAAAVMRNNSVIWAKGYGEQPEPDLIYMTGSVAKTFTATAIFQLIDRGLIELDDDINDYLPFSLRHPDYPGTPITIQMLATHHSGMNSATDAYDNGIRASLIESLGWNFIPHEWLDHPQWIKEFLLPNGTLYDPAIWSINEPGVMHTYSNVGYNVLQYVLELVTGQPIWEYMQENIFDPLEMNHTGYFFANFTDSQLAKPYFYNHPADPEPLINRAGPHFDVLRTAGAGGIRSNVYDLARFLLVHLNNGSSNGTRILSEASLNTMHEIHASWYDNIFDKWGGTEGDEIAFHAKAYTIHSSKTMDSSNTSVPYVVITLLNQGSAEARDACFDINTLLRHYVHVYDVLEYNASNGYSTTNGYNASSGFSIYVSISCIIVLIVVIRKKKN